MATPKRNRRSAASKPANEKGAERMPATNQPETSNAAEQAISASEAPTQIIGAPVREPSPPEPIRPAEAAAPAAPEFMPEPAPAPAASVAPPAAPAAPPPAAPAFRSDESPRAPSASAASLAQERAAMGQRRAIAIGAAAVVVLLAAFLGYQLLAPRNAAAPVAIATAQPAATAAPAVAPTEQPAPAAANPTAAPAVAANPTAVPAANPTAAPAAAPTAQPAAQAPQQSAATGGITCSAIAGLPVFDGSTCTDQDTDVDNNVTKLENTYSTAAQADDVRRFYEGAFTQNGWNIGEFTYHVELGARRLTIEVDTDQGVNGAFTKVKLTERGAPAATGTTCTPIAGLAVAPNATCIKFDADNDDGILKTESTYSTAASPQEIWQFYQGALTQSGWAAHEAKYEVNQGLRRVQITVDTEQGAPAAFTEFKIAEQ